MLYLAQGIIVIYAKQQNYFPFEVVSLVSVKLQLAAVGFSLEGPQAFQTLFKLSRSPSKGPVSKMFKVYILQGDALKLQSRQSSLPILPKSPKEFN